MNKRISQVIKSFRRFAGRTGLFGGLAVCAMTAGATTVTWTGSAGDGKWATAANWDTGSAPVAADTAVFTNAASVTLSATATISNLTLNADITLSSGSYELRMDNIGGSGTLTLADGRIGSTGTAGADVTFSNNIVVAGTMENRMTAHGGKNIDYRGNLSGSGKLRIYGDSGACGVRLSGDDSAFTGTCILNGAGTDRNKFGAATSGSSNATFTVEGSQIDNGSFLFSDGTIYLGALNIVNGGQLRGGKNIIFEIGALKTDCTIGNVNFWHSSSSTGRTIRKVGTGTLAFGGWNYEYLELVNGNFAFTSTSSANLPVTSLKFLGGTFVYSNNTVDASAKILSSTSPISIDTYGHDVTFATALASSNVGGLTKKGSGTLTLSAKPAYTGTTTVEAGTLVVPAGTTFETLAFTNGAALSFAGDPLTWTNGSTVALFTYSSIVGTTNIVITGLGARASVAYDFTTTPGTCLAVISNDKLVWAGADGDDWSAENKWVMQISQEAATFQTGDAVILNDTALGTNPATNSINLSTAVSPILIAANVSAGHGYKLTGEAVTGDAVALKKTGDGVLILTNASNAFAGDVTVDGGELVVSAPVAGGISNNAALRIASAKPVTLGAVSGSGVTYVDSGTAIFTAALAQPVTNNGTAVLAANQTLNQCVSGSGTIIATNAAVTLNSDTWLAGSTGNLVIASGATIALPGGNPAPDVFSNLTAICLAGGTLTGDAVNRSVAANIVAEDGTSSTWYDKNSNINLRGKLSGSGTVTFQTDNRGVLLHGDNSAFAGTVNFLAWGNYISTSFQNVSAGSPNATWNLLSDSQYSRDGSTISMAIYNAAADGEPLRLGAFNVTKPAAKIRLQRATWNTWTRSTSYLEIGGLSQDCAIEGGFVFDALKLNKVGEARLTLGTNFSCAADSTIAVSNGTLEVNALSLSNGTLTVEAPATLAGTGTLSNSVTFADGATLAPGSSGTGTMTLQMEPALAGKLNFAFAVDGTGATTALAVPRLNLSNLKLALASGTLDASKTYTLMTGSGFSGTPDLSALPEIAGRSWKVTVDGNAVALSSTAKGTVYRLE